MPVFVVDSTPFRVPLTSMFKPGALCKELLATDAKRRTHVTSMYTRTVPEASPAAYVHNPDSKCAFEWTFEEDKILCRLKSRGVSGKWISMAMDRSVEDLEQRFSYIQRQFQLAELGQRNHQNTDDGDIDIVSDTTESDGMPERTVTFSDPLVTNGNIREVESADGYTNSRPKVKRIYYIDEDFSLEDVVLLHRIASQWENDRWVAISTKFNDVTGRSITPGQAKTIFDN